MVCPRCGADNSAEILYGFPAMTPEFQTRLERKDIALGDCCLTGAEPKHCCRNCHFKFGSPPLLISTKGAEPYIEVVTGVRFCVGGYFDGYPEVVIKKTRSGITLDVRPGFADPSRSHQRLFSDMEWVTLLDALYCKLNLHEWKKRFNNPDILDGIQWELELQLTRRRKRTYSGSNAFPPQWAALTGLFQPFFREAEIRITEVDPTVFSDNVPII